MGLPTGTVRNLTRSMHYDFKQKLNKIDSEQYRNLRVPEIDWKLNEAENVLLHRIINPRIFQGASVELNQRSLDDIRTLIVSNMTLAPALSSANIYSVTVPNNYMTHLSSYVTISKGGCTEKVRTRIVQYDDKTEESPFDRSSFEWKEVNIRFRENIIQIITDGTFVASTFHLDYIRMPKYFHSATDAVGNAYNLPDGTTLTGYQNCELPEILHREIVDLAVLITTGDLLANYQVKQAKLQITN